MKLDTLGKREGRSLGSILAAYEEGVVGRSGSARRGVLASAMVKI